MKSPEENTRKPFNWTRELIPCILVALILRIGYHVDRQFCVACGQREINHQFFGIRLSHRVVTPPVFPVERYPESETGCRAGQHRRCKVYIEPR